MILPQQALRSAQLAPVLPVAPVPLLLAPVPLLLAPVPLLLAPVPLPPLPVLLPPVPFPLPPVPFPLPVHSLVQFSTTQELTSMRHVWQSPLGAAQPVGLQGSGELRTHDV